MFGVRVWCAAGGVGASVCGVAVDVKDGVSVTGVGARVRVCGAVVVGVRVSGAAAGLVTPAAAAQLSAAEMRTPQEAGRAVTLVRCWCGCRCFQWCCNCQGSR